MSRVRIVQMLCPERHCIVGNAYQSPDGEPIEEMRSRLLEFFRGLCAHGAEDRCGICHSRKYTIEDAPTRFQTMDEAIPYLADNAAQQKATCEFFRAARN
jgi:hypothetical protein